MKGLHARELRTLSAAELEQKYAAIGHDLLQIRLKARAMGIEKPSEVRRLRRDLARVLTVMHEQRAR